MGNTDKKISQTGQSRRRWMASSAALIAGTVSACGSNSDSGGSRVEEGSQLKGKAPSELPAFDAERCAGEISTALIADDPDRFAAWNETLRSNAAGRESAFVDLDALDHNLKRVGDGLGSQIALRLVAKSLPCIELLEYMMIRACTNRVMAFSEGMVRELLERFGSGVDILLGRPAAVDAARRTFEALESHGSYFNPAGNVRWLVDTEARMEEYGALADRLGGPINVSVEIDVGLRRGGARDREALLAMLNIIQASEHLKFAGFMGYEGHVPYAAMGGMTAEAEFAAVQRRYDEFVQAGREKYPSLFSGPLVFNSGGSRTYHYYKDDVDTPVNEVAMGSAFFYPGNFHDLPEEGLRSASFFATPLLKRVDPAETPFDPNVLPSLAEDNPSLQVTYFMTAGDFPGEQVYPAGLIRNPLTSSADDKPRGVLNMLPNQGSWLGSRQVPLEVGDFIFYQPWEGDAVRWLKYLDVFRGGALIDQWPTFQPGIAR